MRAPDLRLPFLALAGALCAAQVIQPPDVVDRVLSNGVRVLMVDRPGTGAVRAGVFIQGGRAAVGSLSPAAADLLASSLFRHSTSARLEKELELPLRQEGAAFEALRLERLRQARRPDRSPSPELQGIQELYRGALAAIQEKLGPGDAWDEVDALGATRRSWVVEADYIAFGIDLPAGHLEPWCRLMTRQLGSLFLGRFPLERERLLQSLDAGEPPCAPSRSVLLSTALAGRPYAQASEFQRSDVEALTLADVTNLGRRLLVPDRLVLVLVGDVKPAILAPALEATFGGLGKGAAPIAEAPAAFKDDDPRSALESPAGRRLLVSTTGETRVLFGWRVPPSNHPDGPALRILAQILGGGPSSRLHSGLVASRGLAQSLTLSTGVPGERDANLLIIDAEPAPGHSLGELEQAIEGEVLRLQREPLPEAEVRRAQKQLETLQIQVQEDAGVLATTLGVAQCQGGDWRLGFQALAAGQTLRPPEIQAAARTYLVPSRMTIAQFGPDPLLLPRDRTEGRLLQVLSTLVQRRITDSVAAQNVLREALRQLRMLSPAEREQTLKLLEAQVAP
jgi:predicted Zn-dependent peptidase